MANPRAHAPQPELELRTAEEIEREVEAASDNANEKLVALINACKRVARELTYAHCAAELEKLWGPHGRHVTSATLRACLDGTERNYFRLEWARWFADRSDDVKAHLHAWLVDMPAKTWQRLYEDLCLTIYEEFPNQAKKLIRKAETR
ncbi:MAG: hypothetical protein QOI20_3241 [Acidimicrobiaceae bacterium]|jgi:hypothetical protein|nr:hypothetical protein [Acidimicrobiaceae bacterium]